MITKENSRADPQRTSGPPIIFEFGARSRKLYVDYSAMRCPAEKHEPVSDIDAAVADSLKALDPERPIREATELLRRHEMTQRRLLML